MKHKTVITEKDAPPRPWRVSGSTGGKLYIYAFGEDQPIPLLKSKRNMTKRDRATMELICMAVNHFHTEGNGFRLLPELESEGASQ